MPKIADIEGTPNKNALKFILKEPLSWGVTHSYDNAEEAKDDPLASALFDIDHVTNVLYIDSWITVTQDGEANWQDLAREIADPIRAAPGATEESNKVVAQANEALENLSPQDKLRLERINILLDEEVRKGVVVDHGDRVVGLLTLRAVMDWMQDDRSREVPEDVADAVAEVTPAADPAVGAPVIGEP